MSTENISKIASDFQTQLSAAIAIGATSFTLQSVTDNDGVDLPDGVYCFTLDRDNTSRKEYLIGQLTSATKTVASISSVSSQGVLTANAQKAHRVGANVIISDHSILAAISRIFNGDGTIDPAAPLEYTTAPTLSSATQIATKGYVDSVVTGGTVNTDRIILGSQTAGETVAAGNIVYFKSSDSRWWKADADLTATFTDVLLGVALGSGTAGNPITDGVQIYGKCDSFSGLTATSTYYLSNTAGAVSSSAGTSAVILGQAFSTTGIFFNPNATLSNAVSISTGVSDAGKIGKLNAAGRYDASLVLNGFKPNAGETINGATLPVPVYQSKSDNEVYACDANDTDKYKFIGFAITNSTDGNPITVKTNGIVEGFTGLSEGEKYYVSDTAGTISTTQGTQEILVGIAISETALLIQKGRRFSCGTLSSSGSTTTITCGYRVTAVRVYATMDLPSFSNGGWTTNGGNKCSYAAWGLGSNTDSVGGVQNYCLYITNRDGTDLNFTGLIQNVTDTTFDIAITDQTSTSNSVRVYWEAEGDL